MRLLKVLTLFTMLPCLGTAQITSFSSGSFIVDMGVVPQTTANGLRPYGLVYDLVSNYDVPVYWVINPNKTKDGTDFLYNNTAYKGGPFVIAAENRTAAVDSRIAYWQSTGVIGLNTTSSFTANVAQKITAMPRWTLDLKSGAVALKYIADAGIPSNFASWEEPPGLNNCNDIFVMPHADPNWVMHGPLLNWNLTNRGSIWASCHAVSVLENMVNPSNTAQQTNFLALNSGGAGSNALVSFRNHKDGSVPYNNNNYPADQVMQFMGPIDGATANGSESIYLPALGGGWRPSTKVAVFDPTQTDVPSLSPGKAAALVYGRGFGNTSRGWVMYEAGHSHEGGGTEDIAAQRAFLNFSFMVTLEKSMNLNVTGIQSVMVSSNTYALSVSVSQNIPTGPYTIQWSSSCGGVFSNPTALNTNYTPPSVVNPTNCVISVKVTDACGRSRFHTQHILVTAGPRPPVPTPDTLNFFPECTNVNPVITINALANDLEPDGQPMTITSVSGTNGVWSINPDQTIKYVPNAGFYGTATASYTVCDNTSPAPLCANSSIQVNIGSLGLAPVAVNDTYTIYEDSVQRFNVLANDIPGSGSLKVIGIPVLPKKGKVSINTDNTITYLPNADYYGEDSFNYRIASSGGYYASAKVNVSIKHDCCAPGNYKRILGPIITTTQTLVATEDSYLKLKSPNTNYGTSTTLVLDRETTDKYVGVLKFDLSALICYATLVRSATMKLQMVSGNVQDVNVYRLLNNWSENQVTWNDRLTSTPWGTPGGNLSSIVSTQGTPVSNIYNWDMNAVMQDMVCNSTLFPNHGFQLKIDCNGCGNRLTNFASREDATAGVLKPTMVITFDSAAFVCAPIPTRAPLAMPDSAIANSNNAVLINPIANDWLPGANTGTISILPGSVTSGTANMENNQISYIPNLQFQGLTSFQYIITDNITGLKDTAIVYVYVSYPRPEANNDSATIYSGESVEKNVLTNDVDFVGLGLNLSIINGPIYGNYTRVGGIITYTAPFNFYGRDTITYIITNAATGPCNETALADTAFFIITVLNRPPIGTPDSVSTNPCQSITLNVLSNDSDPENGSIHIYAVSAVSPVGAGTVSTNGSLIFFVPDPVFPGANASFTYIISDDAIPPALSAPINVTVSFANIPNQPPIAMPDSAYGLSNVDLFINVLQNDSDQENDSLSIGFSGGGLLAPANGSVSILPNGMVKYTPVANFRGIDYFDYRLFDHHQGISGGNCTNVSLSSVTRVVVVITNIFVVLANNFENLTGVASGKLNKLVFSLTETPGNATYYIERGSQNTQFEVIGWLQKTSTEKTGLARYEFFDDNPLSENNFYRVRAVLQNNTSFISNTILLKQTGEPAINLQAFPIPFQNDLSIRFDLAKAGKVSLSMLSADGLLLKNQHLNGTRGENIISLNQLHQIKPGLYYIKLEIDGQVLINKVIKL